MRWAYYRAAARRAGVMDMWLDDAAQEIAIAVWQSGLDTSTVVYRQAAEAARRYGPRPRYRVSAETVPLLPLDQAPDPVAPVVLAIAIGQCWRRLTAKQRVALGRRVRGQPMRDVDSSHAVAARKHLRRMLAA